MARPPFTNDDDVLGPASLYDASEPEEDPWFAEEDLVEDDIPRLDRAYLTKPMFDSRDWVDAQHQLSVDLAAAAHVYGRLVERLSLLPQGMIHRIALQEVSELGWWTGGRIPLERLCLYVARRIGPDEDAQQLGSASWAYRRLVSQGRPHDGSWDTRLSAFLGLRGDKIASICDVMEATEPMHPFTEAAILMHAWRVVGEGRAAVDMEAAVLAAKHAALDGPFAPLALAGGTALRGQGTPAAKLGAFYRGIEQAALAALLLIKRVGDWELRGQQALSEKIGRTPSALIKLFTEWPTITAPLAEEQLNANRATIQRNFELLASHGLIREITGQDRYRVWTASI